MYADISVVGFNSPKKQVFTYLVDDQQVRTGTIVVVPFGKKTSFGIVRSTHKKKPNDIKIAKISKVLPLKPLPQHLLNLADWMIDYYVAPNSSVWQLLLPKNPQTKPRKIFAESKISQQPLVKLSPLQSKALQQIQTSTKPILLEGVMGSGKTEIYFHKIKRVLEQNKSAILLMPEILLTTQMIERARKHFGDSLTVTHSGLTPAQRRAAWDQCNSDKSIVVLGPRSALFSPINNLGLIIIDECHEQSYKQDAAPRYQTEHVAAKLANLTKAKLVLGSATPSLTTRYLAEVGKIQRVALPQRAISSAHPDIKIVNTERQNSILSKHLIDAIKDNVGHKKLSLLYINRRGTAPIFLCQDCGHNFLCPKCGGGLHLHADINKLRCHICGYNTSPPATCSECHGHNLRGIGVGTKAIESEIKKLLPGVRIARLDRDSGSHQYMESVMQDISNKQVDILIGTQMIGRGLDLADLSLVGIVNADYDLSVIDYNSRERAFQLISQTAGRAGRREHQGKVFVQTKRPNDEFFSYVITNNFEGFYASELMLRKKYSYPPFVYLLKLECGYINPELGLKKFQQLAEKLLATKGLSVLGPTQAYPSIRNRKHMWQLVVKSKNRAQLVAIAKEVEPAWTINLDPFGIL